MVDDENYVYILFNILLQLTCSHSSLSICETQRFFSFHFSWPLNLVRFCLLPESYSLRIVFESIPIHFSKLFSCQDGAIRQLEFTGLSTEEGEAIYRENSPY